MLYQRYDLYFLRFLKYRFSFAFLSFVIGLSVKIISDRIWAVMVLFIGINKESLATGKNSDSYSGTSFRIYYNCVGNLSENSLICR